MTQVAEVRNPARSGRPAFAILLAALVIVLIGSFGILLCAVVRTGDHAAFLHPGLERLGDPKDSMSPIGPDSAGNPLLWILGLSRVAAFFVRPVAAVAVLLGVLFMIRARRTGAVRRLAVVTGAWLALGVLSFTPYGVAMLNWLLD